MLRPNRACFPRRRRAQVLALVGALALAVPALAARDDGRRVPGSGDAIESCVGGPEIRFAPGARRALLDASDAAEVSAALVQRYPIVAHDGLTPERIVLWRDPKAIWLYVALVSNPENANEVCFTATFSAARFDVTPPLLVKYFGAAIANE
jgi:hypothetical protein